MFLIKFTIYFSVSFIILSVPIGNKQVFNYIHAIAKPYTNKIFSSVKGAIKTELKDQKESISILRNKPLKPIFEKEDRVKRSAASATKKTSTKHSAPKDEYTPEERAALLRVFSQH